MKVELSDLLKPMDPAQFALVTEECVRATELARRQPTRTNLTAVAAFRKIIEAEGAKGDAIYAAVEEANG